MLRCDFLPLNFVLLYLGIEGILELLDHVALHVDLETFQRLDHLHFELPAVEHDQTKIVRLFNLVQSVPVGISELEVLELVLLLGDVLLVDLFAQAVALFGTRGPLAIRALALLVVPRPSRRLLALLSV